MSQTTSRSGQDKRLSLGAMTQARMFWGRLRRILGMDAWFPHVPLALAVGLAGLIQLLPHLGSVRKVASMVALPAHELGGLPQGFDVLAMHGLSQELIGSLLVLLSMGLLRRSRLAWVLTVLLTVAALGLQFAPHKTPVAGIVILDGTLLVLLLLARDGFQRASLATGTLFALVGVLLTMGYGVLGSYALGTEFSPNITDFDSALYFTVVTMSTVGYGDILPHTADARLFAVSLIVLGLVVFATSLTAIAGPLISQRMLNLLQPRKKSMKRNDHIIVVGETPLARNAVKALSERGMQVTAVWKTRPAEGGDAPEDVIVGDGGDADVLKHAGVEAARAVLALGENDYDNAFVALAAKDANEQVRTVVAVSDARNMARVRHARPDTVLALPVIGGELLAMALSGEEIKADALLEQLLRLE